MALPRLAAASQIPLAPGRGDMRVALVTEFYHPHLGGVTEHVHNLALQFRRQGHRAIVLTANMAGQGEDPPWVRRVGTSRVIYSNASFARLTTGRRLLAQMEDVIRRERCDLVHVQDVAPTLGIGGVLAGHRLGLPVVATLHTWFDSSLLYRLFRAPYQRGFDRLAAVIAVSAPVVDAFSRHFRIPFDVIPNGVDTGYFSPDGRDARPPGADPQLLFLGRLDPRNGLETLLAAMPAILARYPRARLTVAGDGPLRVQYERQASSLGAGVRFTGQLTDARPRFYRSADLYLCPTTKASFGITLLEAMACGTPLVVSDITGFRELVNGGHEAVLVPAGDVPAWARAVIGLLADDERRARMSAAGRAKAEEYDWGRIAERVLRVYRRVLG